MSVVEPEPHALVWTRHHSQRNSTRSRHYEYMGGEADTLCLMPSSMRVLCALMCALLIFSLAAAIFNTLQGSARGSASFCKRSDEPFRPNILNSKKHKRREVIDAVQAASCASQYFQCPRETMFFYYNCCLHSNGKDLRCCAQIRVWLLIAIVCVTLSCVIGLSYTIFWYCCTCEKTNSVLATPL